MSRVGSAGVSGIGSERRPLRTLHLLMAGSPSAGADPAVGPLSSTAEPSSGQPHPQHRWCCSHLEPLTSIYPMSGV